MAPSKSPASKELPMKAQPTDWIPEGYVIAFDLEDWQYIVLEFMVPAMHQIYAGYHHKQDLNAFAAAGGVSTTLLYCLFI